MALRTYNMIITQGDSHAVALDFTDEAEVPIDMTGTTYRSYIKLNTKLDTPLDEFTVSHVSGGRILMTLTDEQTDLFPVTKENESNILYYDLEVTYPDGSELTEVGGTITILEQVTK